MPEVTAPRKVAKREKAIAASKADLAEKAVAKEIAEKTPWMVPKKQLTRIVDPTRPTKDLYGDMYRQTGYMLDYAYLLLDKFSKKNKERFGLGNDIKNYLHQVLELVIDIVSYNPFNNREQMLRKLSVKLKTLDALMIIARKQRQITPEKYEAFVRRSTKVDNLAIGIAMWLEKEDKKVKKDEKKT